MDSAMKSLSELLIGNYKYLERQYALNTAKQEALAEPTEEWWNYVGSESFPSISSGMVYQVDGDDSLNTTLWLIWMTARAEMDNRVLIAASNISAKAISMHLWALVARCSPLSLADGSFEPESWRRLAAASGPLDASNIQVSTMPIDVDQRMEQWMPQGQLDLLVLINAGMTMESMTEIAMQYKQSVVSVDGIAEVSVNHLGSGEEQRFLCLEKQRTLWQENP